MNAIVTFVLVMLVWVIFILNVEKYSNGYYFILQAKFQ